MNCIELRKSLARKQVVMASEDLIDELQFELESLIYAAELTGLEKLAVIVEADISASGKNKRSVTKSLRKAIEGRLDADGEIVAKVEWLRKAIEFLNGESLTKNADASHETDTTASDLVQKRCRLTN